MPSNYPGGTDTFPDVATLAAEDLDTTPHSTLHGNLGDAIEAIEGELGLDPAGASATVAARFSALDTTVAGKATTAHAHAGEDITSGTVADARIASTIARDSEVTAAIAAIGTWADWTPALTVHSGAAPNLGSTGVALGRYCQIGKLVTAHFRIQFGGTGISGGGGLWRISLPVAGAAWLQTNYAQLGTGHIHDASQGFLGLGPGAYRHVLMHTVPALGDSVAGVVMGHLPRAIPSTYTTSNVTTDRTYDADSTTMDELADVFGTLVADYVAQYNSEVVAVTGDDVSGTSPWTWASGDQFIGLLTYEAA